MGLTGSVARLRTMIDESAQRIPSLPSGSTSIQVLSPMGASQPPMWPLPHWNHMGSTGVFSV